MRVIIIKRTLIVVIVIVILLVTGLYGAYTEVFNNNEQKVIAIIIDDFGNNGKGTETFFKIKERLTVAVLPNLPYTVQDAQKAHENGFEVIVHLPMEPLKGEKNWLPPDSITSDLSPQEVLGRTSKAFDQVPYAVGFNNHMGSKITSNRDMMYVILKEAKKRNFYVVDSKTIGNSLIDEVSEALGVKHYDRDLFLDRKNEYGVYKQVLKLAKIAEKKGYAIGIGHVGPEGGAITASGIMDALLELEKMNIKIVYVSQLK
ncbi:MAG: divergent polysaccharide deacetylase family protein [Thermoanaerobacteraceae bacterium]|nr:divergent polysaccharide deacetylase family protein [Thermoanaerobacteraceae bacterium]